jgi:serine/threonine-protein kinase
MESILSGLGYLHARGVIHRDVTPENILVARSGAVKVTDFGISRKSRPCPDGKPSVDGKVAYLSPEALEGSAGDPRSDLYSAALIGAELLLGRPVFRSAPLAEARRIRDCFDPQSLIDPSNGAGAEAAGIVAKALSFRPEDRFQEADAFCMAIQAVMPFRATRTEAEAFWNSLFPERSGEVTELDIDSGGSPAIPGGNAAIVRENRLPYGSGVRGAAIGIAAAFSIVAGGSYLHRQLLSPSPAREASADRTVPAAGGVPPSGTRANTANFNPVPHVSSKPETTQRTSIIRVEPVVAPPKPAVEPDVPGNADLPLPVRTGEIPVIQAIPWARVYEGNRYLGDTPLRGVGLPVGEHRLRFVNEPLGAERIVPVTVLESGNQKLIVTLVGSRPTD